MKGRSLTMICLFMMAASCDRGPEQKILRVGAMKDGVRALLEQSGALKGAPYQIQWASFAASTEIVDAMAANAIDTAMVGGEGFAFTVANGKPVQAVQLFGTTGRSTVLLVPPGSAVHQVPDLAGRRIATARGSSGHSYLLSLLEQAHVPLDRVKIVYLANSEAASAFSSRSIDAWSTWGLSAGHAILALHARPVDRATGGRAGLSVQAASPRACASRRADLGDFARRLRFAFDYGRAHPRVQAKILAQETGSTLAEADYATHATWVPVQSRQQSIAALQELVSLLRRAAVPVGATPVSKAFSGCMLGQGT